ncbi:nucleolin-like [Odontomachus brunneus]|uniref:nucleolin-like n=1 Tax=Odontomachus brunneus TaxID=486640 RepID=UPI0013F20C8E|nr:nucleolin-like [Odontomachus brunneus]
MLANKWQHPTQKRDKAIRLANGTSIKIQGKVNVPVTIDDRRYWHTFDVIPNLESPMLIGVDLWAKLRITLPPPKEQRPHIRPFAGVTQRAPNTTPGTNKPQAPQAPPTMSNSGQGKSDRAHTRPTIKIIADEPVINKIRIKTRDPQIANENTIYRIPITGGRTVDVPYYAAHKTNKYRRRTVPYPPRQQTSAIPESYLASTNAKLGARCEGVYESTDSDEDDEIEVQLTNENIEVIDITESNEEDDEIEVQSINENIEVIDITESNEEDDEIEVQSINENIEVIDITESNEEDDEIEVQSINENIEVIDITESNEEDDEIEVQSINENIEVIDITESNEEDDEIEVQSINENIEVIDITESDEEDDDIDITDSDEEEDNIEEPRKMVRGKCESALVYKRTAWFSIKPA